MTGWTVGRVVMWMVTWLSGVQRCQFSVYVARFSKFSHLFIKFILVKKKEKVLRQIWRLFDGTLTAFLKVSHACRWIIWHPVLNNFTLYWSKVVVYDDAFQVAALESNMVTLLLIWHLGIRTCFNCATVKCQGLKNYFRELKRVISHSCRGFQSSCSVFLFSLYDLFAAFYFLCTFSIT